MDGTKWFMLGLIAILVLTILTGFIGNISKTVNKENYCNYTMEENMYKQSYDEITNAVSTCASAKSQLCITKQVSERAMFKNDLREAKKNES